MFSPRCKSLFPSFQSFFGESIIPVSAVPYSRSGPGIRPLSCSRIPGRGGICHLTRPVSGAPCFSSYRFALWPLSCGRVMFLPAIYVRYGQTVAFHCPLSLTDTHRPPAAGFIPFVTGLPFHCYCLACI